MMHDAATPLSTSSLSATIQRMLASAHLQDGPDDDLLHGFIHRNDEAAFHALVRRHGGMVWSVCRYVLRNEADAEDAFQATFLLLATKARAVGNPRALAGWLHEAASRVSRKALTAKLRRQSHEARASPPSQCESFDGEDQRVVQEELCALPEKYRVPLVLFYLDGQTHDQAAGALGLSNSGIRKRLERGRELLQTRLVRRGLGGVSLAVATTPVSTTLAASTAALATGYAAGTLADKAVPAGVLALINQGVNSMFTVKLLAIGSLVTVTTFGVALLAGDETSPPTSQSPRTLLVKITAPVPAEPVWKERPGIEEKGQLIASVAFSPDGKMLAVGGTAGKVSAYWTSSFKKPWETDVGGNYAAIAYSTDGKTLAATFKDGVRFLNAETGKEGDVLEEKDSNPTAVAFFPDKTYIAGTGQVFVSRKLIFGNAHGYEVKSWLAWPQVSTLSMTTTPKDRKPVDDHAVPLAVDPKGRSAVITGPIDRAKKKNVLWAYVAGDYDKDSPGNRILEGHKATVTSAAWSQDGQAVVTGDIDGVVIVRDAETMKEKNRAEFKGRVVAVAVNRDGTRAAAAVVAANPREESEVPTYREKVFVWDPRESPKDPKPLRVEAEKPLRDPFKGTGSLAFSPDGKMLAAAFCNKDLQSTSGELVGKVRIWELATPAKP